MWYLVITMFAVNPGVTTTNSGSIKAKVGTYEECMRAKDQVIKTFRVDNYRVNAGCIILP
jgi:hypothetical protein